MKFKVQLPPILEKPELPANISKDSKWLSGVGAGSWFEFISIDSETVTINRYDPNGGLECSEVFEIPKNVKIGSPFLVTYPSFCNKITIMQDKRKTTLFTSK